MRERHDPVSLARAFYTLLWKDYTLDYRSPLGVATQLLFSVSAGILAGMAYRAGVWQAEALLPVSLVIVLVFNSIFQAYSTFLREREQGTLDALRLLPTGPGLVYVEKAVYSYTWITGFTVLYVFSYVFFTGWSLQAGLTGIILWVLAAGLAMAGLSSLASALLVYSMGHTTLAPMIVIILSLPFFHASLPWLGVLSQGLQPGPGWLGLLAAFSLGLMLVGAAIASAALE